MFSRQQKVWSFQQRSLEFIAGLLFSVLALGVVPVELPECNEGDWVDVAARGLRAPTLVDIYALTVAYQPASGRLSRCGDWQRALWRRSALLDCAPVGRGKRRHLTDQVLL